MGYVGGVLQYRPLGGRRAIFFAPSHLKIMPYYYHTIKIDSRCHVSFQNAIFIVTKV